METGYTILPKLTTKLKAIQFVSFRMILQKKEDLWFPYTLVVDVLPEWLQGNSPCFNYNYGPVAFIAGMTSGEAIREWLLRKTGEVYEYTFQFAAGRDAISKHVSWTRYPSYASTRFSEIPYPLTEYEVRLKSITQALSPGYLVGDNCPFFRDFRSAASQLIYGVTDPYRIREPEQSVIVCFIRTKAYIEHVDISPTSLSVAVAGSDLLNTQLQISGPPELQQYEQISQSQRVDCLLPNGMPPDVWVVLSRGNEWLDYSYLGQRWSPFDKKQNNVTFSPPDIRTRIQELIVRGEGPTIEFKEEVPSRSERLLKTVAAFANGEGGVILLGVENENGDIVGITGDANGEEDRITNMIRNIVVPEPQIRVEHCDINEKQVIAVYVDKGDLRPYGLLPDPPKFYVRRGATTFPAKQEEIRALAQPKQPGIGYQP